MMIFSLLIIIAIFYFVSKGENPFQSNVSQSKALEQLNQRYVDGEIDEQTYQRMKKNIEK